MSMKYKDLRDFIAGLEAQGELKRITTEVDPYLEMTEICDRTLRAKGPALLFENPKGYDTPVLANLFGTPKRVALGMGAESVESLRDIGHLLASLKEPEPPKGFKDALGKLPLYKKVLHMSPKESLTKSNTKISVTLDEKNIYFNNSIGDITAVDIKSGQLIWQLPTQNNNISQNAFQLSNSELVINENTIFFSNNKNEFYSIDTATGLINWKTEISSDLKPVVIGKLIITISEKGYLYIIDKKSGNIIRINDLFKNYKDKKRNQIKPTGFFVALNKIYLTNSDGKLIIVNSNDGNILNVLKISGGKILQPFINENNLFLISNGSIIKFN